ncbi:DUF924 family protein [Pseudahrensia aquimaris]|uniref:DUF924 family protein n=1 Tax=Pseudahrensia aquimaris TaxID=744461 RepID=A0ABW3FBM1_9HYPH
MSQTSHSAPKDILDFWEQAGPKTWWTKNDIFDAEIKERFSETHKAASDGLLDHWDAEPKSALALILLLDQFTRNLNRNSPLAFSQDAKGLTLAKRMIERGDDEKLDFPLRQFAYLPLMHSEILADQNQCVAICQKLDLPKNLEAAVEHREIIEQFGRFPHRNSVLGRKTTPEEQAFLDNGGFRG